MPNCPELANTLATLLEVVPEVTLILGALLGYALKSLERRALSPAKGF